MTWKVKCPHCTVGSTWYGRCKFCVGTGWIEHPAGSLPYFINPPQVTEEKIVELDTTHADLEAARIATAEAGAGIGVLVARVKELEAALEFYADIDNWNHEPDGTHWMEGAFDGPTVIELDRGGVAQKALGGDA